MCKHPKSLQRWSVQMNFLHVVLFFQLQHCLRVLKGQDLTESRDPWVWSSCRTPALRVTQLGRVESALHCQHLQLFCVIPVYYCSSTGKACVLSGGLHWHDSDGPPRAAHGPRLFRSHHWCVVKRSVAATLSPAAFSFFLLLVMLHWWFGRRVSQYEWLDLFLGRFWWNDQTMRSDWLWLRE